MNEYQEGPVVGRGDVAIIAEIPGDDLRLLSRPRKSLGDWQRKIAETEKTSKYITRARLGLIGNSSLFNSKELMNYIDVPDVISKGEDKKGQYAVIEKVHGQYLDSKQPATPSDVFSIPPGDKARMIGAYLYFLDILNSNQEIMTDHKASSFFWSGTHVASRQLSLVDAQILSKKDDVDEYFFSKKWQPSKEQCWRRTVGISVEDGISVVGDVLGGLKNTLKAISLGGIHTPGNVLPELPLPWVSVVPYGIQNLIAQIETYHSGELAASEIIKYTQGLSSRLDITKEEKKNAIEIMHVINSYADKKYQYSDSEDFGEVMDKMNKVYDGIREDVSALDLDGRFSLLYLSLSTNKAYQRH